MENNNIKSLISDFPLKDILESAEAVAPMVPVAGNVLFLIIKVIKLLIPFQKSAANTFGVISDNINESKQETFKRMWTIALSDGVITNEEKDFLRPFAKDAGISDAEFELMVLNKTRL